MEAREIETLLEGILFAAGEPVLVDKICQVLKVDKSLLLLCAENLRNFYQYERRGIRLVQLDKTLQLVSDTAHAEIIRQVLEERRPPPMSKPALEVLSLIAYYQPTTRAYVDGVRGVDSSGTITMLCDKGLIEECGRLDVPGRPTLFRTTPVFLRSFGLTSLDELPDLPLSDDELEGQLRLRGMEPPSEAHIVPEFGSGFPVEDPA